jgi:hypothetical protein
VVGYYSRYLPVQVSNAACIHPCPCLFALAAAGYRYRTN